MLYLIKSFTRTKSILKVGYTDNLSNRMKTYFYTNPGMEIISTREGDELLEDMIQMYLKFLGYQYQKDGRLDEWFVDDPRVYQIFHISQEELGRKLWKNREKIFNISRRSDLSVYEYLKNKNLDSYRGVKFEVLDSGKVIPMKCNKLDVEYQNSVISKKLPEGRSNDKIMDEFLDDFYSTGVFTKKLKLFCDFMENNKDNLYLMKVLSFKVPDPRFKNYYNFFGLAGCRARRYREDLLRPELLDILKGDELSSVITSSFKPGDKLGNKQIKEKLRVIYSNLKFSKNPKATDLEQWFDTRPGKVYSSEESKWVNGLELLSYKK